MNRRQFIQAGVVGGAALAAGGAWFGWRDRAPSDLQRVQVKQQERIDRIIGAIAPVILLGTLPEDPQARAPALKRVSTDIGNVIAHFTPPVQKEVHELFGLLDIGIARRLLTGVSSDWSQADPAEISAFLDQWRHSRIEMLQSGYHALHDLVFGAWYASDATWAQLAYAGPPAIQ